MFYFSILFWCVWAKLTSETRRNWVGKRCNLVSVDTYIDYINQYHTCMVHCNVFSTWAHEDITHFISSCTQSQQRRLITLNTLFNLLKRVKKTKYSESKLVRFLPASEYMKNLKEQGWIILAFTDLKSVILSLWGHLRFLQTMNIQTTAERFNVHRAVYVFRRV